MQNIDSEQNLNETRNFHYVNREKLFVTVEEHINRV